MNKSLMFSSFSRSKFEQRSEKTHVIKNCAKQINNMAREGNIFRGKDPEIVYSCFGYIPKCKGASHHLALMAGCQAYESLVCAITILWMFVPGNHRIVAVTTILDKMFGAS